MMQTNAISANMVSARLRWLLVPHRLALLGITLVAVFFNFWMLGRNGYGNQYYAAAVKSMGSNWHAFFFVSLDPAGFVTVDKPPLGFWLQVLSTKIFGFTPFAIFLPQALAGVLAVVLLYWLVRRHFGPVAGLISAFTLAVSPISVVTNRNNTIDSTLVLVLLVAAWTTFRAIETGKIRWLIASSVLVGLGFNIKMLEAYLVVPAFALAYLLGADTTWLKRLGHLALTGLAMLAVSLSWVLAVDLIPATLRPYVGSTQNNSELSLALGYNGVQRLLGVFGGGGRGTPGGGAGGPPSGGPGNGNGGPPQGFPGNGGPGFGAGNGGPPQGFPGGMPGGGTGGPGGGGTGMFNTGNPGLFRLFTEPLGGQIVWLLPLALIGMVALAAQRRFNPRQDRQQQSLILWGVWLMTMAVFFSVASFFHQYYLSQMTPAIAALTGIGMVTMWHSYQQPGWRGWLLPLALAATALEQIFIITSDSSWGTWLIPVVALPVGLAAVALSVARLLPELRFDPRLVRGAVVVGLLALLAVPTFWSAYPALNNIVSDLPTAGAATMVGNADPKAQVDTKLIAYLEAHQGSATYLVATPSSNAADPIILATGKAVMALGGFTGTDPILTSTGVQTLVKQGVVRYFLLNGGNTRAGIDTASGESDSVINVGGPNGDQNAAVQWVEQTCTAVASSDWQSTTTTANASGPGGFAGGQQQLYDCAGK